MLKDVFANISQNKNLLMFVSVSIYILALFATFSGTVLLFALILTTILFVAVFTNPLPIKYVLVWIFIFYFGIFNTSKRLRNTDDLLNIAPQNSTIYGKVLSIPQYKGEDKIKFFFKVDKIELKPTKKGDPMVSIWFTILAGKYKNSKLFMNHHNGQWDLHKIVLL